ncbi:MYND-type domain-containing protein [Mycena indigotica]|uniref:phytol kinase n=1 Tax=Mycena indigotica TaxID=2126181 RepID=A0A8H6S4K9_9AGAR|nr:MYND-type domain-containing protein [Mycena indigotica]KAF7292648.1 MYND-type domain-containing protein [Mycena indigotica]
MVHPSLHVDRLSELPDSFRRTANAALRGTVDEMQAVVMLLTARSPLSKPLRLCFLPVLYVALEPASISSLPTRPTRRQNHHAERLLQRAMLALEGIRLISIDKDIPDGAVLELWPRIWAWIQTHMEKHDFVPFGKGFVELLTRHLALVHNLTCAESAAVGGIIRGSAGLCRFLGAAWGPLLAVDDALGISQLSQLFHFAKIGAPDSGDFSTHLGQLKDGAGGTWDDLATLLVLHLDRADAFLTAATPMATRNLDELSWRLRAILPLVSTTFGPDRDPQQPDADHASLRNAAIKHGILSKLAAVLLGILNSPACLRIDYTATLAVLFSSILPSIAGSRAPELFPEVLRADFLLVLFKFAALPLDDATLTKQTASALRSAFGSLLPALTVYHPVLVQLRSSVRSVANLKAERAFRHAELVPLWNQFMALIQERLLVLKRYEAGELTSQRGCNNGKCVSVQLKSEVKQCGKCRTTTYCSRECQREDWKASPGHRDMCAIIVQRRAKMEYAWSFDKIQSFVRALLNCEYTTHGPAIDRMRLAFFDAYPDPQDVPCVLFDFKHGPCEISVASIRALPEGLGQYYAAEISHMIQAHGRLQLHFAGLHPNDGATWRWRVFPLYVQNDAMYRLVAEGWRPEMMPDELGPEDLAMMLGTMMGGRETH